MKQYTYFISGFATFNNGEQGWFNKDVTLNGIIMDRSGLDIAYEAIKEVIDAKDVVILNFKLYTEE